MYCSQCGKKVAENMLFCPFCGSPIVIPDQEAPEEPRVEQTPKPIPAPRPQPPIHLFDDLDDEQNDQPAEFVPLDMDRLEGPLWEDDDAPEERGPEPAAEPDATPKEEAVRLQGRTPDLNRARPRPAEKQGKKRKVPSTYVPQREFNPNDIFLDGEDQWEDDDYSYEEPEEGGFVARHIRGFVALALFVVVLAVLAGWAFSSSGQRSLARAGLAWSPSAYAGVAYDAYRSGGYAQAGSYYAQALDRDSDNYDYANSAAVAYYMAQDFRRAEEVARRAIAIDAGRAEGYQLLVRLYPDPSSRTEELSALIEQGYQRTGDESLKPSGGQ